jgi:RNA polymerase sigma-70 factor (ECF subfamily)
MGNAVLALDESNWVRESSAGDRNAFARLVDRYWEPVRRWLFGLTGREHAAEDIAQDTFLKAWTALPTLRDVRLFRVWLFQIARRCWIDARRRSGAVKKFPLIADVPSGDSGPLHGMIEDETQQQLQLALATLPSSYRAAYLLWTHEELPYSEIAQILGVSEETARWRVCKARQSLKEKLSPYLQRQS